MKIEIPILKDTDSAVINETIAAFEAKGFVIVPKAELENLVETAVNTALERAETAEARLVEVEGAIQDLYDSYLKICFFAGGFYITDAEGENICQRFLKVDTTPLAALLQAVKSLQQ